MDRKEPLMKTLILYYSFEGSTHQVATWVAEATGADLERIHPQKELPSKGFSKYLWGGRQVVMKESPPILPLKKDLEEYDRILLGTPIWAGTCAPPVHTLLTSGLLKDKEIHYFYTHDGGSAKALERIRGLIEPKNHLAGSLGIRSPRIDPENKKTEVVAWATAITHQP